MWAKVVEDDMQLFVVKRANIFQELKQFPPSFSFLMCPYILLSNREKVLPPSPLPGTVRVTFTAYGSRISQHDGRAAEREE